jgi:hypothetical protein
MRAVPLIAALGFACVSALAQAQLLDPNVTPEFRNWQLANPWYGTDEERTKFAIEYAKQLAKEKPGLSGRPLLDEVSRKVEQTFGPAGKAQKR